MQIKPKLVNAITEGIQEKKGHNIVVADLRNIVTAPCSYFVICQGNSPQQVQAVTKSVGEIVLKNTGEKPARIAGLSNAQWVAMDYGNVLVHIFLPDRREFYDLENLWDDAKLLHVPDIQ